MRRFKRVKRAIEDRTVQVLRKKPDPYYPVVPMGPFSIRELLRFLSVKERRYHAFARQIGNFRLRKRGYADRRIIDWRR